jgi:hypothetical protein
VDAPSINLIGGAIPPPLLSILPDSSLLGQDKQGGRSALRLVIAPVWPSQLWLPQLLRTPRGPPMLLPHTQDIISGKLHPLVMEGYLPPAAWPISGSLSVQKDYWRELLRSSRGHGGNLQNLHTQGPGIFGIAGAFSPSK